MALNQNPSHSFVSNIHDRDPISLEPIESLGSNAVFYVKASNNSFNAYDAEAWLPWLTDGNRVNPCTKQQLSPDEIWECFMVCHNLNPDDATVKRCQNLSVKLSGLTIVPISPLLNISILSMQEISKQENVKEVEVQYNLIDSRNGQIYAHKKTAIVEMPIDASLSIGF